MFDDRLERPGIKFYDADLIGIPVQIIVGKNFIENKEIGVKNRNDKGTLHTLDIPILLVTIHRRAINLLTKAQS